jgi:hypothetical protein
VAPSPIASPFTAAMIGWRIASWLRTIAAESTIRPGWPSG